MPGSCRQCLVLEKKPSSGGSRLPETLKLFDDAVRSGAFAVVEALSDEFELLLDLLGDGIFYATNLVTWTSIELCTFVCPRAALAAQVRTNDRSASTND